MADDDAREGLEDEFQGVRVLALGDSLTAGYHARGLRYDPYGIAMEALVPDGALAVDIQGIPGEETTTMVRRVEEAVADPTFGAPYDIAILLGGTNDLGRGARAETVIDNLTRMHRACSSSMPTVAMTIPHNAGMYAFGAVFAEQRRVVNDFIMGGGLADALGTHHTLLTLDLDTVVPLFRDGTHSPDPDQAHLWDDGIHFTPDGYAAIADALVGLLTQHGLLDAAT